MAPDSEIYKVESSNYAGHTGEIATDEPILNGPGQEVDSSDKKWSRGYKKTFRLNSAEHEIENAHKYKKYHEIQHFQA